MNFECANRGDMSDTKTCNKCGQEKAVGEFRNGHNSCKECAREYSRKWYKKNLEKERERCRKYCEKNREKVRESRRKYREENLEKERESNHKYCRKYREKNREKLRERERKYREENPEKARESVRKYREENPEKARESRRKNTRKRRARKRGHEIPSEAPHWTQVGHRDNWTCHICGEQVQNHWDGPHAKAPTVDHIIPLSKGGPDTFDNVKLAHFGCNASRGTKEIDELAAE